jgi:PAS domain S-box-containing protein
MTPDGSSSGENETRSERYESIVETIADGVFVLDPDGTVTFVNSTIESFTGLNRETLIGGSFGNLVEAGFIGETEYERFIEGLETVRERDDDHRLTLKTKSGAILELRLRPTRSNGTCEEIVGTVRDVTDRERALETIEKQQHALYRLYETDVNNDLTVREKLRLGLEVGCEFLDLPIGFLTSIDGETHRFDHVVGSDELESETSRPLEETFCQLTVNSEDPVAIRDATEVPEAAPAYEASGISCYIGTKIPVGGDLYGTFCFAAEDARDRSFSPAEREFVRLLGLWAGHKLERQRFETVLHELHGISQEMMLATSKRAVAEIAIGAAGSLFDLPITVCWQYDSTSDTLRPIVESDTARDVIGDLPTVERGEAAVWESFETGEMRTISALDEGRVTSDPERRLESEVHIPLGEQGVLVSASTEPRTFQNVDMESLTLLGNLLQNALADVEQQESLAVRGEALQEQNKRLEEFAHVVAHDLRNPLAGAVGFLEIARETHDQAHFDRIEESHDRMQALIDELLGIARGARQAVDPRGLSLAEIVEEAWSYGRTENATLEIEGDLGQIEADETRLLQLFGNLFRNSVQHAGVDVHIEVGSLESGFYVADDGPGLPEGAREDILTLGSTASKSGTGIGLQSVTDIIEAHGWKLAIPETDDGVRFEIHTDRTTEEGHE